jgi:hypothetical protein
MGPARKRLVAATAFAMAGLICGLPIVGMTPGGTLGSGWGAFPGYSAAGAFLSGLAVWRTDFSGRGWWRGALAGAACGLVAHPVTWYVMICANWAMISAGLSPGPSAGQTPLNPVDGLAGAVTFSIFSVLVMGPITVPAGAVVGAVVGAGQERSNAARSPSVPDTAS